MINAKSLPIAEVQSRTLFLSIVNILTEISLFLLHSIPVVFFWLPELSSILNAWSLVLINLTYIWRYQMSCLHNMLHSLICSIILNSFTHMHVLASKNQIPPAYLSNSCLCWIILWWCWFLLSAQRWQLNISWYFY